MNSDEDLPKLYTQTNCGPCDWCKQWLDERGVKVQVLDIKSDFHILHEFKKLGSHATPTLVVGDRILEGFNKQKWSEALGVPV